MIDDMFRWQLEILANSRSYREKLAQIKASRLDDASGDAGPVDVLALLASILLIEMHQRPAVSRVAEWIVSTAVPRSLRKPITRGPLQIADGPWNLDAAIRAAYSILSTAVAGTPSEEAAIYSAAVVWNGKAVRQPCSAYGYGEVLHVAYDIARLALLEMPSAARWTTRKRPPISRLDATAVLPPASKTPVSEASWKEGEGLDVARTDDAEVTTVDGRDLMDA